MAEPGVLVLVGVRNLCYTPTFTAVAYGAYKIIHSDCHPIECIKFFWRQRWEFCFCYLGLADNRPVRGHFGRIRDSGTRRSYTSKEGAQTKHCFALPLLTLIR
jgi:hypothetical protein